MLDPAHYNESVTIFPPCFKNEWHFLHWQRAARLVPESRQDTENYCMDCTPAYQRKMIARGCCNHPETQFVELLDLDGETELVGVRT